MKDTLMRRASRLMFRAPTPLAGLPAVTSAPSTPTTSYGTLPVELLTTESVLPIGSSC